MYNIEVTTEDREITDSLATLNTVFKLTKKTITNREYVTFGNELSSKLIKLNKGSMTDFIKIYHDKYDGMVGFLDDKKRIILDD